eukprot:5538343-Pyramimonas_sp.AAC.1
MRACIADPSLSSFNLPDLAAIGCASSSSPPPPTAQGALTSSPAAGNEALRRARGAVVAGLPDEDRA